jgi:tetratricopeptide (TPR) repeat protein
MKPSPSDHARDSFEACVELARSGHAEQALDHLARALSEQPQHAQVRGAAVEALIRISRMAEGAGDLAQAARALEEALRIAPRFADVHYRLARVHLGRRQEKAARKSLEAALRINPEYVAARVERALLDAREGFLGEAIDALRKLDLARAPHEPRLFHRGIESLEHADWQRAGSLLRQALHLDEPGVSERVGEARTRLSQGDRAGAARLIREALAEHPAYADLHCLLGIVELEEGHVDDAIATLAHALELHPDYHAARVQLARALEASGDLVQAEEQIGLVLEADPQNPAALELAERWGRWHRRSGRSATGSRKAS